MIWGLSIVVVITILIVVDVGLVVFRFWFVERQRESLRLEIQKNMRETEAEPELMLNRIMKERQAIVDSIGKMQELTQEYKAADDGTTS